jgi:oligopeptide/dipeptide ABC transporter ATP-binding protein
MTNLMTNADPGDGLAITALSVRYPNGAHAVRGVNIRVAAGRTVALVGESGCGKTTVAMAVLGLLPAAASVTGSIRLAGHEIVGASEKTLHQLRGLAVGLVAQDPMRSFNPLLSVGTSIGEAWRAHRRRPPRDGIADLLATLGIPQPRQRVRHRPHQWSGGMLQRAAIAAAAAHTPPLIVADEPTSALDADRADAVLDALRATGAAVLLISHDLSLVGRHSDEVAVMYAGSVVEHGPARQVLAHPRHPYAAALLAATPRPGAGLPVPLPGAPPPLDSEPVGCSFATRCPHTEHRCTTIVPPLYEDVACHLVTPDTATDKVAP